MLTVAQCRARLLILREEARIRALIDAKEKGIKLPAKFYTPTV